MNGDIAENPLHRVELALTKLAGVVEALVSRVDSMEKASASRLDSIEKSSNKDTQQILVLLQPRLEAIDKNVSRNEAAAIALEARVDARIDAHMNEAAPHDPTIGERLGRLENTAAFNKGALAVLAFFSPVAAALLTKVLGGS